MLMTRTSAGAQHRSDGTWLSTKIQTASDGSWQTWQHGDTDRQLPTAGKLATKVQLVATDVGLSHPALLYNTARLQVFHRRTKPHCSCCF